MIYLWKFFLLSVLFSSAAYAASSSEEPQAEVNHPAEKSTFQELLTSIDEESIHAALHSLSDKFRHGIFSRDSSAVEALHQEDAPLATLLLNIAKRQAGGASNATASVATTSASPAPSSTESTPSSTATPTTTASTVPTTAPTAASTTTSTTDPTTKSTTKSTSSPSSAPTTTSTTTTPTETSSTAVPSTTTTTSSSAAAVSTSSTTFATSTSSSSTESVTKAPSTTSSSARRTPYTSTHKSTTTLPNGSLSTVTAITVVQPAGETASATAGAATGSPGLQANVASTTMNLKKEVLVMLGGAVAVAMAL